MNVRDLVVASLLLVLAEQSQSASAIELITNGSFASGFSGWSIDDLAGGSGTWNLSAPGSATPLSIQPTAPNASGGTTYAVTDQTGPGTHVLRQTFSVPAGSVSVKLSFQMFVNDSDGGPIVNPAGLDYNANPNQHARVDILTAAAAPFSTAPADIIGNFYLGVDPQASNPNPYKPYLFDITGLVVPGGTYQVRFGEVDNQLFLNQGVDNVSLTALVPEPTTMFLLATAIGLIATTTGRRRS